MANLGKAMKSLVMHAGKHPCVVRARIQEKGRDTIRISADRRIQSFLLHDRTVSWRLDKDEISSNFVRMRQNVLRESFDNPCNLMQKYFKDLLTGDQATDSFSASVSRCLLSLKSRALRHSRGFCKVSHQLSQGDWMIARLEIQMSNRFFKTLGLQA